MEYKHNKNLTPNAKTLRKNMTKEEKHLWYDFLKTCPVRFIRQKVIENYIADFYCREAKLVIELDGSQHFNDAGLKKDLARTEKIQKFDLLVLRFDNLSIKKNFEGVCIYIDNIVKERIQSLHR